MYRPEDLEFISPMYQEFDGSVPEMEKKCLSCMAHEEEISSPKLWEIRG